MSDCVNILPFSLFAAGSAETGWAGSPPLNGKGRRKEHIIHEIMKCCNHHSFEETSTVAGVSHR